MGMRKEITIKEFAEKLLSNGNNLQIRSIGASTEGVFVFHCVDGTEFTVPMYEKKEELNMQHPESCWSHDMENNCTIVKWGESGYYKTDYPKGKYPDEIIDEMNARRDITPEMRHAMECCSMAAQFNPDLDWEKHYEMIMSKSSGN